MLRADTALSQIESLSHTRLSECYQCGKCAAGCPRGASMDATPTRLLRWLQTGEAERALSAAAPWDCVSCQTCTTRCPQGVDCASVMDALRQTALARGLAPPGAARIIAFQQAFLDNIRRNGRLAEIDLIADFKLRAFRRDHRVALLFQDALLAPALHKRRKLHLRGERVRDTAVLGRIFARCDYGGGPK